jgi:transcriptional regulator with GAF, ATPase, and Fis domain
VGDGRAAEVLTELADTLVDDFEVVDLLQTLAERCVEVLGCSAAGLLVADDHGRLRLVAEVSWTSRAADVAALHHEEGPCHETFATGRPVANVRVTDEVVRERWPVFTAAALRAGVRSVSALPMRLRGEVVGVLNLLSDQHGDLGESSLNVGQAMADLATIGLSSGRSEQHRTLLAEQARAALQSRIVIEQARGVVAAQTGVSVEAAFTHLRGHARRHGTTLAQVATAVVEGELQLDVRRTPVAAAGADGVSWEPLDLQILRMVGAGISATVVARRLGLPLPDVAERLRGIRLDLETASTVDAVHEAHRQGLI